jgi:hypothetical protein
MSNVKFAPATAVREFATANGITVGKRGLLNPAAVEAFNKAHKGKAKYEPASYVETVEVKAMKVNASGRKTPIRKHVNIAEAREAAKANGVEVGERGRLALPILQAHATGDWSSLKG